MDPGFASTCPRSTSSLSTPRSKQPTLSPACPSSSSFRNISTPVTTALRVSRHPTISTSSPPFTSPPPTPPLPAHPPPPHQHLASIGPPQPLSEPPTPHRQVASATPL